MRRTQNRLNVVQSYAFGDIVIMPGIQHAVDVLLSSEFPDRPLVIPELVGTGNVLSVVVGGGKETGGRGGSSRLPPVG